MKRSPPFAENVDNSFGYELKGKISAAECVSCREKKSEGIGILRCQLQDLMTSQLRQFNSSMRNTFVRFFRQGEADTKGNRISKSSEQSMG